MGKYVVWDSVPFLTQRPLSDSPEIFKGANLGICSIGDFLNQMSAAGICSGLSAEDFLGFVKGLEAMKVFRHKTKEDESIVPSRLPTIQDRVTLLLISLNLLRECPVLFQFWAPIKASSGQTRLTLSGKPFRLGDQYNGLRRYSCNEKQYGQNGPPARVFKRGLREVCHNIIHYSTEEFPTRDCALDCGIVSYFALPLFESGATQHCVGVLECFSLNDYSFYRHEYPVYSAAQQLDLDLVFPTPHFHKCDKIRRFTRYPRADFIEVLKVVEETHQLPLIQVWVPCMCDDPDQNSFSDKLFCDMRLCSQNLKCSSEFENFRTIHGTSFVRSGEGLVGRAYSQYKPCFFGDMSQLSLSDNPFAHMARSAGLTACFVIPLVCVHPMLDDLFLEIFCPSQGNGNSEAILKSLLFTVAQEFSKLFAAAGLKQDEEFQVTLLRSDSKKFDYFHINRRISVNVEMSVPALHNDPNAQEITTAMAVDRFNLDELEQDANAQDIADSSREIIATIAEDHICLDVPKQHPNEKDTTDDTSGEVIATLAEVHTSLDVPEQHPNQKGTTDDTSGEVIATMAEIHINLDIPNKHPNEKDTTGDASRKVIAKLAEDHITFEVLQPYFGSIIDAAAKDLGVSRSTLKRRCRELGIKRWPWHKRNRVRHVQSNPRLQKLHTRKNSAKTEVPQSQTSDNAAERVVAADSVAPSTNGGNCYDMIGKATYEDDIVMFPLSSSSGIEELRRGLKKRFELQVERLKIKYKFDDDWILITCDQDLHLGLNMIKSTGKNTMNLSIFPQPSS